MVLRDIFADVNAVTAGLNVSYVYVDDLEGGPAGALDHNGVKLIMLSRKWLDEIPDKVMRVVMEKGLRFHEGLEQTFGEIAKRIAEVEKRKSFNRSFYHALDNIIGDVYARHA